MNEFERSLAHSSFCDDFQLPGYSSGELYKQIMLYLIQAQQSLNYQQQ